MRKETEYMIRRIAAAGMIGIAIMMTVLGCPSAVGGGSGDKTETPTNPNNPNPDGGNTPDGNTPGGNTPQEEQTVLLGSVAGMNIYGKGKTAHRDLAAGITRALEDPLYLSDALKSLLKWYQQAGYKIVIYDGTSSNGVEASTSAKEIRCYAGSMNAGNEGSIRSQFGYAMDHPVAMSPRANRVPCDALS